MQILQSIFGIVIFLLLCIAMSENRKAINYKTALLALSVQILFTIFMLKVPAASQTLIKANTVLKHIVASSAKASSVVFGQLACEQRSGFILAIQSFPVLITISALSAALIKLRILPFIINAMSRFFRTILQIGGTLGIAVSANIFTGMAETPLVITPYLSKMTRSELFSLMTCGAAGLATSVIIILGTTIEGAMPNGVTHIMSSALISIPTSILVSRLIIPETDKNAMLSDDAKLSKDGSFIEAIFTGILNGGKIVATIIVMLIGFISLIDVLNTALNLLPNVCGEPISIQRILGVLMSPLTWLIGLPTEYAIKAGSLIGSKLAFNEMIAFQDFANLASTLDNRSKIIIIYALAGFSNIGSAGIMIGIYSSLMPERKKEVMEIAFKAVIAGAVANLINAAVVALFL